MFVILTYYIYTVRNHYLPRVKSFIPNIEPVSYVMFSYVMLYQLCYVCYVYTPSFAAATILKWSAVRDWEPT